MNTPRKSPDNQKSPEERRIITSRDVITALLVIAAFAVGRLNVSKDEKELKDNKPVPCIVTPDIKASYDYEYLKKRIAEMKEIEKALPPNWGIQVHNMSDDEILDKSRKILRERREKQALEFIAELGIKNQADKDTITHAFLNGHSQVDGVDKDGISLTREDESDSGIYELTSLKLEEEIEVPKKYLDEDDPRQKTPEGIEMAKLIEDGRLEEALNSVDTEKILKAAQKEGVYDLFYNFMDLMEEARTAILSTDDPYTRKMIACRFRVQMTLNGEEFDDFDSNPNLQFARELMNMFMESIMRLTGIEEDDECELDVLRDGVDCLQTQARPPIILHNEGEIK